MKYRNGIKSDPDLLNLSNMKMINQIESGDMGYRGIKTTPVPAIYGLSNLDDLISKLATAIGKQRFLVFKNNKYTNVLTDNIAFFYINYESSAIMCFDKQEYFVDYSLEQIQRKLNAKQFFRINRQYLVNFAAIKEVEHYFARKLLVNLSVPTKDKILVSREKVRQFLDWLDER